MHANNKPQLPNEALRRNTTEASAELLFNFSDVMSFVFENQGTMPPEMQSMEDEFDQMYLQVLYGTGDGEFSDPRVNHLFQEYALWRDLREGRAVFQSFGLSIPGYLKALGLRYGNERYLGGLEDEPAPKTSLLLGCDCFSTAWEYLDFIASVNPNATALVADVDPAIVGALKDYSVRFQTADRWSTATARARYGYTPQDDPYYLELKTELNTPPLAKSNQFIEADALSLDETNEPESVDVIFTNFLLGHLRFDGSTETEAILKLLKSASAVLREDGQLILVENLSWQEAMDVSQLASDAGLTFERGSHGVLNPHTLLESREDIKTSLAELAAEMESYHSRNASTEFLDQLYAGDGVTTTGKEYPRRVNDGKAPVLLVFTKMQLK